MPNFNNGKASVFLFPNFLAQGVGDYFNQQYLQKYLRQTDVFFVENIKPTRQMIKFIDQTFIINNDVFFVLKHNETYCLEAFKTSLKNNKTIGIFSDAGCACIADPGFEFIAIAQELNVEIVPLIGGNSILLSLMASGLNGQQFTFHGYLPIQENERKSKILFLEKENQKTNYTQIFIETPFRNQSLFQTLLHTCSPQTLLSIGISLTSPQQKIITKKISDWQKTNLTLEKIPIIFLLGKK